MNKIPLVRSLVLVIALTLLAVCISCSSSYAPPPLSAGNINLIFVVSNDLAYGGSDQVPTLSWPQSDYDTIWTVKLDAKGNLTVDNALCEGMDTTQLPASAPQF